MPATNVGNGGAFFQLFLHTIERGNPIIHEIRCVVRAKETLRAFEKGRMMLVPANAAARAEGLGDLVLIFEYRRDNLERTRNISRAIFLRECKRLLRG